MTIMKYYLLLSFTILSLTGFSQHFEGQIKYSFRLINNDNLPDSVFNMKFQGGDDEQVLFYSNGNYKTIMKKGKSTTLFNQEEDGVQYSYLDGSTFGMKNDLTKASTAPTIKEEEETQTVLEKICAKTVFAFQGQSGKSTWTFYFSDDIKIDSTLFSQVQSGPLELFFKKYGTIPLKMIIASDIAQQGYVLSATEIERTNIESEVFEVPKFEQLMGN